MTASEHPPESASPASLRHPTHAPHQRIASAGARAIHDSEGSGLIRAASADELRGPLLDALVALYRDDYRYDPDDERVQRVPGLVDTFSAQPGVHAQVSVGPDGRLDGMSFGYTTAPGERRYEFIAPRFGPDERRRWLDGASGSRRRRRGCRCPRSRRSCATGRATTG